MKGAQNVGWTDRLKAFGNIWPLLKLAWRTAPRLVIFSVILRVLHAVLPVINLYIAKLIIDSIFLQLRSNHRQVHHILQLILLELAVCLASDFCARFTGFAESVLMDRLTRVIDLKLIEHAAALDLQDFETSAFYDKLQRAQRHSTGRTEILEATTRVFQTVLSFATLASTLYLFSPTLLLLLALAVAPLLIGETDFAARNYAFFSRWTKHRRELDYLRLLSTSLESAQEIKAFGLGSFLAGRYRRLAHRYCQTNRKLALRRALFGSMLSGLATFSYYIAYASIIYKTLIGILSVGSLAFLTESFWRCRVCVEDLVRDTSALCQEGLYVKDLFEFLALEPRVRTMPKARRANGPMFRGIEFQHVSFRYSGCPEFVLRDVSFRISPGERVALVGENGSGKSTIAKLIPRFYDPIEGAIKVDGVDLRELNLDEWRSQVTMVLQNYVRYEMMARENIGVGSIGHIHNHQKIEEAARLGGASSFIQQLPRSFDQKVGRRFEGSMELSGGEWQRLALARSLVREAQLAILDEPTSALDPRNERSVVNRFLDWPTASMTLLISHRFSTVRRATRILVLRKGSIAEEGTHVDLVGRAGIYAEFFENQASGYR